MLSSFQLEWCHQLGHLLKVPSWWPAGRSSWAGDCPGQPWQDREGSHSLCGGATSTPGDKVQRLSGRVALATWDLTPQPPLCSSLHQDPDSGAAAPWPSRGSLSRELGCLFPKEKAVCVCTGTSAGGIRTLMAPVKAFLLLTTAFRHSGLPLSPARDKLVGSQC